ncbi:MAG TPA: cobalt-precorrin-6A reductase [Paracoccus sp. (in: a-proteobacteria)]|nr:cobalt-precorrin-6A reductase [Paracoccus sp. (in: a-proteobacteria)]
MRILLLGGTTEAGALARALAAAGADAVYSYAGRTRAPVGQPLPTRTGGFGGTEGLRGYLRTEAISHVIDATHPFAARISANAVAACACAGVPLLALERPGWTEAPGDNWTRVPDLADAARALPRDPANVFLAIGRQNLDAFAGLPHRFLLRFVDAESVPLPGAVRVVDRGPFTMAGDMALMQAHHIGLVVAKDAGGTGARAKLDAARALGLPVILIDRPAIPARPVAATVDEAMAWLHRADRGV